MSKPQMNASKEWNNNKKFLGIHSYLKAIYGKK